MSTGRKVAFGVLMAVAVAAAGWRVWRAVFDRPSASQPFKTMVCEACNAGYTAPMGPGGDTCPKCGANAGVETVSFKCRKCGGVFEAYRRQPMPEGEAAASKPGEEPPELGPGFTVHKRSGPRPPLYRYKRPGDTAWVPESDRDAVGQIMTPTCPKCGATGLDKMMFLGGGFAGP